jgi:hypothetical protein
MPNILKRPMFRKGGSVTEGTGITSGLTPKRGFVNQPGGYSGEGKEDTNDYSDENFYNELMRESLNDIDASGRQTSGSSNRQQIDPEYIKSVYQQLRNQTMPTPSQRLSDYLTAFGASGAGPTDLQTWGSALGRTGQLYTQIEEPKEREATKYGAQAALMGLRGLSRSPVVDESERKARLAADNRDAPNSKYQDMSYEEAYAAAYNDIINKKTLIRTTSLDKSEKAQIELKAKDYVNKGLKEIPAAELADIEYKIKNDPKLADIKARWQGPLLTAYVEKTPTGTYKIKDSSRQNLAVKKLKANDLFYHPDDRTVVMYTGPATGEFVPYGNSIYQGK